MKNQSRSILIWIEHSVLTVLLMAGFVTANAQVSNADTLKIGLPAVEKLFLEKNLSLLASKYQIEVNKALIEQAKLWDNPVLVTDQNIFSNKKFFEHGKDAAGQVQGQYFIQIQQLIKTAGKRSKLVNLATTNTKLSDLQFAEMMRTLKYQLRTDYYTLLQLRSNHYLYTKELIEIQHLQNGMKAQFLVGNIAQKELLRIQALIISVQQDLIENDKQVADIETELKNLLQLNTNVFIEPIIVSISAEVIPPTMASLLSDAKQYNSSYLFEQTQLLYQQQNLSYQKALKSPDITVGPEYDHNSNYTPHYVGLSISLPLPILNKNQGNIKSAQLAIKQEETVLLQTELQLNNAVQNALNKWYTTAKLSSISQKEFYSNYETLFANITDSYQKKQIGLIEFIDFFDAYKDVQQKLYQQQLNLLLAKEELNYQVGKDVIN